MLSQLANFFTCSTQSYVEEGLNGRIAFESDISSGAMTNPMLLNEAFLDADVAYENFPIDDLIFTSENDIGIMNDDVSINKYLDGLVPNSLSHDYFENIGLNEDKNLKTDNTEKPSTRACYPDLELIDLNDYDTLNTYIDYIIESLYSNNKNEAVASNIISEVDITDARFNSMVDGGFDNIVDSRFDNIVDSGFGHMVDARFDNMVDSGFDSMLDSGFGHMVDSTLNPMVDGGFDSMVDMELNNFSNYATHAVDSGFMVVKNIINESMNTFNDDLSECSTNDSIQVYCSPEPLDTDDEQDDTMHDFAEQPIFFEEVTAENNSTVSTTNNLNVDLDLLSAYNFTAFTEERNNSPSEEKRNVKKKGRIIGIKRRISSNRYNVKKLTKNQIATNSNKKMFNRTQISHIMDVINQNKDSYRLFMINSLKSVYPEDIPAYLTEEFSDSNLISLRSLTIKKITAIFSISSLITENTYDKGKLHTDFRAYYRTNNVLSIKEEVEAQNKLLKRLYVCYENKTAFYSMRNYKELSLNVYRDIMNNVVTSITDIEKSLLYFNLLFKSIIKFPILLKSEIKIPKIFIYNLLIYASTRLDSNVLTMDNCLEYFRLELDKIFTGLLLPEETDYIHALIFFSYMEDSATKKEIFTEKINDAKYRKAIAFYHLKYLYYIFYNIHRLGPFTQNLFYKSLMDFPGSLNFFNGVIEKFLTNTLYLLKYTKNLDVNVNDRNAMFAILDHVMSDGLKYLRGKKPLEERLESLLKASVSVIKRKKRVNN